MKSFISKMLITSAALSTLIGTQAAFAQEQTGPRASSIQELAPSAQAVDEGTSGQTVCRHWYSGGPKNPATC